MLAETCAQLKEDFGPNYAAAADARLHIALQEVERNATQPDVASSGSGCVHCPLAPVPSHFKASSVYATVECSGLNSFWGRSATRFWQRSNIARAALMPPEQAQLASLTLHVEADEKNLQSADEYLAFMYGLNANVLGEMTGGLPSIGDLHVSPDTRACGAPRPSPVPIAPTTMPTPTPTPTPTQMPGPAPCKATPTATSRSPPDPPMMPPPSPPPPWMPPPSPPPPWMPPPSPPPPTLTKKPRRKKPRRRPPPPSPPPSPPSAATVVATATTADLCPTKAVLQSCHRLQYVNASRFDGFSQDVVAAVGQTAQQICIEVAVYQQACEEPSPPKPADGLEAYRALRRVPVVGESTDTAWGNSGLWAVRAVASAEKEPPVPTIAEGKSFVNLALGEAHSPSVKVEVERQMLATAATMRRTLSDARRDGDSSLRRVVNGREARQLLGWFTASRPPRARR